MDESDPLAPYFAFAYRAARFCTIPDVACGIVMAMLYEWQGAAIAIFLSVAYLLFRLVHLEQRIQHQTLTAVPRTLPQVSSTVALTLIGCGVGFGVARLHFLTAPYIDDYVRYPVAVVLVVLGCIVIAPWHGRVIAETYTAEVRGMRRRATDRPDSR